LGGTPLHVKIEEESSLSFDISKSEYDNHIALSRTNFKEKGLNSETAFVIKKKYHIGLEVFYLPTDAQ